MTKISVVGLGKLGQPFAVCLAARGFNVLGIDKDKETMMSLNENLATLSEPGLQDLLERHYPRMDFTTHLLRAIDETDITFVLVGTPSKGDGSFSTEHIEAVLDELGAALAKSNKPQHTFVIGSTVSPGASATRLIPALTRHVGRERIRFAYCPELVALGNVVEGFLHPDFVVIGTDDTAWPIVRDVYDQMTPGVEVVRLTVAEAEIFKVALNFFLTLKISFANMLAGICEMFPRTDVDHITEALGRDSRISYKFLRGGMAFGGFCFPRDVRAFKAIAPYTLDNVNDILTSRVVAKVVHFCIDNKVSILGLSFKPGTPEIEASPSVEIVKLLMGANKYVTVHDPMAIDKAKRIFYGDVIYANDAKSCAGASPVVVLATAWPEYFELEEEDFQEGATVIDCWRMLKHKLMGSERVKYVGIGLGQ